MQTTNPFEKTVGLKGVQPDNVSFSVWINDLPGMSTELVSAIADSEDESQDDPTGVKATWTRVCRLGLETLSTMLEGELSKSADFSYIGDRTGDMVEGESELILLPSAQYHGYSVMWNIGYGDELFLKDILLDSASEQPVNTTIKVFSVSGKELFTKDVTVNPEVNRIDIGYSHKVQLGRDMFFFVGVDCTELSLRSLGSGQCIGGVTNSMQPARMAVSGLHKLGDTTAAETSGILLNAFIRRSLIDQIAKYEDRFRWAYAYVVGSLLMTEKLASPNINLFTNTNRMFTEEHRVELMDEAKKKVCPIARDIIKALRPTPALQQPNPDDQRGYYSGSFI